MVCLVHRRIDFQPTDEVRIGQDHLAIGFQIGQPVDSLGISICLEPFVHYSKRVGMIRALAVNHQGIALLAEKIVAEDLATGRLRRILPEWQGSTVSIYAVTETRLIPAKTQRFIEFLSSRLEA